MFGKGGLGNLMKQASRCKKNAENAGRDQRSWKSPANLAQVW